MQCTSSSQVGQSNHSHCQDYVNFAEQTVPIAIHKMNLNEKSRNESELENNLLIAPLLKEYNNYSVRGASNWLAQFSGQIPG